MDSRFASRYADAGPGQLVHANAPERVVRDRAGQH